ncbi:DUF1559 domain-containing protein [bacterium]|nr:DUF1559 domain-containing protein [bacterium]
MESNHPGRSSNLKIAINAVLILGGMLLVGVAILFFNAVQSARHEAYRVDSLCHMKQLVLAIHYYQDDHGVFPAAYTRDADGKPRHSWRVAILPYVDEQQLYDQYDFNQPWDSPHNLKVARQMPEVFASPLSSYRQVNQGLTTYVALAGPDTVLSTSRSVTWDDIPKDRDWKIVFVEDETHPVPWTKPEDISPEEFLQKDLEDNMFHGTLAAMASGNVCLLSKQTEQPMVSIDGQ